MKIKKLGLVAVTALGGVLVCGTVATAQEAGTNATAAAVANTSTNPATATARRVQRVDRTLETLTKTLSLTDEQKPKVEAVLKETAKKRREVITNHSLSTDQRREQMRALNEEQTKQYKAIFTSEQFEKYKEWLKARTQRNPNRQAAPTAPAAGTEKQ